MTRRICLPRRALMILCAAALACLLSDRAQAEQAYGRQWGTSYNTQDWNKFYHYPYVYYPQNYWNEEYFQSNGSMYYRYPREMQIPVYNKQWHNEYPQARRYHQGHHFILDIF